jgi:hypothetical protein
MDNHTKKGNQVNPMMIGDFYEDEYGSIYHIIDITLNTITLCRLRDNLHIEVEPYTINTWISNGALTVYLTAEELSA